MAEKDDTITIKIKRKYVKKNKESVQEGPKIEPTKRKYTRKLQKPIDNFIDVISEVKSSSSPGQGSQETQQLTSNTFGQIANLTTTNFKDDQRSSEKLEKPVDKQPDPLPTKIEKTSVPKRKYVRKTQKKQSSPKNVINSSPIILEPASEPSKNTPNMKPKLIQLLKDLAYIMRTRKEFMRAKAYENALETVESYEEPITDPKQLYGKPGIGNTIMNKFIEFTTTGSLKILNEEKDALHKKRAMDVFSDIYGVGEKKAAEIVDKGITTLTQLETQQNQVLNEKQRIGLKYYQDILQRIPRSEIEDFEKAFVTSATSLTNLHLQIVGSYRRQMPDSGDIDVILTSENPKDFVEFIDTMLKENIIVEVLSRGPSKCLVIAKLPWATYARRIDFLYTSPKEYPFAILYFTGSKGFNTVMRERALAVGLTMNEHGFSKMEGKKKGEPVVDIFSTEKDIFDYLKLEYKEPHDRKDGKSVILLAAPVTASFAQQNIIMNIVEKEDVPPKKKRITKKKKDTNIIVGEQELKSLPKIPENEEKKEDNPQVLQQEKQKEEEKKKEEPEIQDKNHEQLCKVMKKSAVENISQFKQNGIKVLESLSEVQLAAMLEAANNAFHCMGEPVMTDGEYDILHEYIENKFPKSAVLQEVGAVVEKNKAKLPYEMWSMDKIKPDSGTLDKWKQKYAGPYVISCKLDGVSGLYTTEGPEPKLYTRGDGKVGQDVSYLIPYLRLPKDKDIVIRGEFIIKRQVFDSKYKTKFANPRNLVAGIANAKTVDDKIRDVDFVAYEVIKPENLTPSQQMVKLSGFSGGMLGGLMGTGLIAVQNKTEAAITNETLSETLQEWRKSSVYEIDGIIVSDDRVHPRTTGNPDHSFAFKMVLSDQMAETHVVDVIWQVSKDGYLKPRVQVMPIKLGGVTIQYATGFNADFIEKNKIGVGAVIQIIRSGDVIPYIKSVTTPAESPKMPEETYHWNDTHVDIVLDNVSGNATVLEKQIAAFFKGIEVDGLGPGNVKKIIKAGHDSVPKILRMTEADLLKVEGFQQKTAKKLFDGIHSKIDGASLTTLMTASQQFGRGFGQEVVELIMTKYPEVLKEPNVDKLVAIPGIGQKTAERFVEHIPKFMDFVKECGLEDKIQQKIKSASPNQAVEPPKTITESIMSVFTPNKPAAAVDTNNPLFGKSVAMTGFRDKELEAVLKTRGAKVSPNIKNGLLALLVKSMDENQTSGKLKEAKDKNIPIMTVDEFKKQYIV